MCQTKDLTGWAHSSVLKQQCVTGGCAAAICVGGEFKKTTTKRYLKIECRYNITYSKAIVFNSIYGINLLGNVLIDKM